MSNDKIKKISVTQNNKINHLPPKTQNKKIVIPEEKTNNKKVISYVSAAAISGIALGGIIMNARGNKIIKELNKKINDQNLLSDANKRIQEQLNETIEKNKDLQEIAEKLKKEINDTKNKFDKIFVDSETPEDVRNEILEIARKEIQDSNLEYNIMNPPKKTSTNNYSGRIIDLPSEVTTTNRANAQDLTIPEINNGNFDFTLPISNDIKITKEGPIDFNTVSKQPTTISQDYASSVVWNSDKIARDILQNFYDGHGQTLDGVHIVFKKQSNNKYRVRIEGKSTYNPDKALLLGASSKKDNANAAGNYGEGLKMITLKLLDDYNADNITIGSNNWKITYELANGPLNNKKVLTFSLDKVDKYDGNYLEFETNNIDLLESLRKTTNRFYHYNNPDFKCPNFENNLIGIKILPENQKGKFYIAGQNFEVNNNFDGLNGISIFLKEKPDTEILNPSRDRISLSNYDIKRIARQLPESYTNHQLSDNELVNLVKCLEKFWAKTDEETPANNFLKGIISMWDIYRKNVRIKFPEKYIAYSNASTDIINDLERQGYIICHKDFTNLGMPTIQEFFTNARAHKPIEPNDIETKKILILKNAIDKLSPALQDKHFSADELNTKIYLFDKKLEHGHYKDCLAEAITEKDKSNGFWIDKTYLNKTKFSDALETALHELSHKAGGDETREFSYKLTDVNACVIEEFMKNPKLKTELNALNTLWNELSSH